MTIKPTILLTNDDGIDAPGLRVLARHLRTLGRLVVVAPAGEKSAVSHALTLKDPLRLRALEEDFYALDGTPADCILVAMNRVLTEPPQLVVSGINAGSNLGDDVMYSGTVAAAREGSFYEVPAIAFSLKWGEEMDYEACAGPALDICRRCLSHPPRPGTFLNVNFPAGRLNGLRVTRLSRKTARSTVHEKQDPRGQTYYWIGLDRSVWDAAEGTDYWAVNKGFISLTPLHRDQTSYDHLERLRTDYEST
jgi:5'-nucleotidase